MKNTILLILVVSGLLMSCNSEVEIFDTQYNAKVECAPDSLPKYDGEIVTLLDGDKNPIKDTLLEQIEKRREVYKPCRQMVYRAIWKDESGDTITNNRIKMMATGLRWELAPELQDEILIKVEYSNLDVKKAKKHQLNKGITNWKWVEQVQEGIIENVEEIWTHPFRFNQYTFTEVAPFPEIRFPIQMGQSWTGGLNIKEGWGDWSDTSGYFEYKVVDRETIKTNYGSINNCWHIKSRAVYPFGNSTLEYWFHESFGFVKKHYRNYGNQTLTFELEEVIESNIVDTNQIKTE